MSAEEWARTKQPDPPEIRPLREEISRLKRRMMRRLAGEQILIDAVQQAYEEPVRIKVPSAPKSLGRGQREISVLHISDVQLGKTTESYDSVVADQRLQMLVEKVARITEQRRALARIEECRVYLGGDIVEGENIFPSQAHQIDQSVLDQAVKTGPEILARAILALLHTFKTVRIHCVVGNHGRVTGTSRSSPSHPRTNWDRVCYEVLRLMLLGPDGKRTKRITMDIADSFYAVDRVFGWGNLIVHGDQITGGFAGFPFYGAARKTWGWIDAIPEKWDYLWFGHFHTFAAVTVNHRIYLANGSTESDNDFARSSLAAAGFPCQRFSCFNEDYGLIADHQIFLSDRLPQSKRWPIPS